MERTSIKRVGMVAALGLVYACQVLALAAAGRFPTPSTSPSSTTSTTTASSTIFIFRRSLAQQPPAGGPGRSGYQSETIEQNPFYSTPYGDQPAGDAVTPKEYLVALYVIPLWLCLILICVRGTARWSVRRHRNAAATLATSQEIDEGSAGDTARGLTASQIHQLKVFPFRSAETEQAKPGQWHQHECSVCMEALEEGDVCAELPCGHVFHRECVTEWLALRPSCPICREDTGEALERAGENENEGEGAMVTVPLGGPNEGETRDREEREEPGWMDNPLYRLRRAWRAQNRRGEEYDRRRTEAAAGVEREGTASAGTGTAEGRDPPRSSPEEPTPDPPRRQRRQRRLRFGLCSIECT